MSHSFAYRHPKNPSSSAGSGQRLTFGSRSTSTGTPPQTPPPTIRVTSPVPDAIKVIDIWDPELAEIEPPPPVQFRTKCYKFCYTEDSAACNPPPDAPHAKNKPPEPSNVLPLHYLITYLITSNCINTYFDCAPPAPSRGSLCHYW